MAKKPKSEIRNPKSETNPNDKRRKRKTLLVKASGSVGANYIEANEALSKKDFRMRIRISRKEVKESRYWLRLLDTDGDAQQEQEKQWLTGEATELMNIFGSILRKSE